MSTESTAGEQVEIPPAALKEKAHIKDLETYEKMYKESIDDPEKFWAAQAEELITWKEKWNKVVEWDFNDPSIKWFLGAKLNASYNCLDRHVDAGHGDQDAIIWEGNDPSVHKKITYKQLLDEVCQFSNALKELGIQKGDRICIYMQMVPEAAVAILACARIGAVHSVVFGAFSPDSLIDRINDSSCKMLITQDTALRGTKQDIPMKTNGDKAVENCPSIEHIIVLKRTGEEVPMKEGRDVWYHDAINGKSTECEPEWMDSEDPLFILYTSGSTGKPKGVLHTTGGYLLYAAMTHKYVFDLQEGDIFWCTADIGWVTGHSYIIYGPLSNRATNVMFEGVPTYPDFGRFWEVVAKHKVNTFYTAPTALRALMKEGDSWVEKHDLSSLKILGTVGEPIKSPEWNWYYNIVGKGNCPIVDTWWQTETGGIMITPLPAITKMKPGSATRPFFGIRPSLVDEKGKVLEGNGVSGNLCIDFPWPGMMRTLYGDHKRFKEAYFSTYPGKYFTGDGCRRDDDGYYWITGRVDDVMNISGHRLGTAEVEGALGKHQKVAEAAVVGMPHDIKGQGIYAFVTLKTGEDVTPDLEKELVKIVRTEIGPHASPDKIQFTSALPKTRSGKIMRRILRKIAEGVPDQVGDVSTLADPSVVEALIKGSKK